MKYGWRSRGGGGGGRVGVGGGRGGGGIMTCDTTLINDYC